MINKILIAALLALAPNVAHAGSGIIIGTILGVAISVADVILVATLAISAAMAIKAKNVGTGSQSQSQQKQTLKVSRPPKQVIYGEGLFAGSMLFAEEQIGDEENDDGTYDEWLHTAFGFCDHEVQSVDEIFFDEKSSTEYGGFSNIGIHNSSTSVDTYLLANAPSWKDDMIGRGTLWLGTSMRYDREKYAGGLPTVLAKVRGRKLFDPRSGLTIYSNNAALVIYDYFTTYRNVPHERMIVSGFGSFIDAANLCDELVQGNPRYTINGRFNLSEKWSDILGNLLVSCGGSLVRTNGHIGLLPAAYYGAVDNFTLTSSDIIGNISIKPEASYSDAVNTITGTFVDPDQDYVECEYPPVVDNAALVRDGGELTSDLNFLFVTNADQAQRLASIQLNRNLAGGGVELETNLKGLYCRVGRVINLDLPEFDLIGEYRVVKQSGHISTGVTISLVNDGVQIYDDAIGKPFVPPPLTSLPTSGVREPASLRFTVDKLNDIVQGRLSWEIRHPQSASTDVRVKNFDTDEVVYNNNVTGKTIPINGLNVGNYLFEVRTISTSGAASTWVSMSLLVDVPSKPDRVIVDQSNWNIRLTPVVDIGVPQGTIFEFKYLADGESYLTGNPTYEAGDIMLSETVFSGSSFNHGGLIPDRYNHYWVRSINAYGSSDWTYVKAWTLRESDLVTTVVERLEAIEIVSSNFLEGKNGYKLWPDGKAEFNDVTVRGHIEAESGSFKGTVDATDGSFRGTVYATDGEFHGTVYAASMVGDVFTKVVRSMRGTTYDFNVTGRGRERYIEYQNVSANQRFKIYFDNVLKAEGASVASQPRRFKIPPYSGVKIMRIVITRVSTNYPDSYYDWNFSMYNSSNLDISWTS